MKKTHGEHGRRFLAAEFPFRVGNHTILVLLEVFELLPPLLLR